MSCHVNDNVSGIEYESILVDVFLGQWNFVFGLTAEVGRTRARGWWVHV